MAPKPPKWRSPLMYAIESENLPMIKLLVDGGGDIEGLDRNKLFLAEVVQNNLEMVKYCCSLGTDAETTNMCQNALHFAVEYEAYEVARYLVVDVNVSPDRKGLDGETAFERAFRNKNVHFIELLIKAGYDPSKESCLSEDQEDEDLDKLAQKVQNYLARCTLKGLCVLQVRHVLGRNPNHKVQQLPIPSSIKELLQLDHIPLNTPGLDSLYDLTERRRGAKLRILNDVNKALACLSLIS